MFDLSQTDHTAPGGVYLCQISEQVSCGACCGLYNVADTSRSAITEMLSTRTDSFANVPRNMDRILEFKASVEAREAQARPFPEFHHCPYIGLVGEARTRAGCLLHPMAEGNRGTDFRGLSFYGGMACRIYFCRSCRNLPKRHKQILRQVSNDWYLYGLTITEERMWNAFFNEIEKQISKPLTPDNIAGNDRAAEVIQEFMQMKLNWPFRSQNKSLCNYFFEDGLYSKPRVRYEAAGSPVSRYDIILAELLSSFDCRDALSRAESLLDEMFDRLNRALTTDRPARF